MCYHLFMDKKIVFIDCDNTLVTATEKGEQYIPESAIVAIKQARENGILVYLCTGRSLGEMDGPLSKVTFDGIIGGSGAFVMENGEMIYHHVMDKEDVSLVVKLLNEIDAMYMLEGNGGIYANRKMKDMYMEDERVRCFGEIMQPIEDADYSDVNKIVYISLDLTVDKVNDRLNNRYDVVGLSYGNNEYGGEISTRNVSKGSRIY